MTDFKEFALIQRDIAESRTSVATKSDIMEVKAELLKWCIGIAMFQTVTFLGGIFAVAKILHP